MTVIGKTDLPSQMSGASSSLYSNNISKFLLHMVDKESKWNFDLEDPIVRGAVVTHNKEFLWPNPNPPMLDAVKKDKPVEKKEVVVVDKYQETLYSALQTAGVLSSILALGVICPDPHFMAMTTTFALSVIAGY